MTRRFESKNRGSRRGFSLIEVLIAMAILSIAIVALADLFMLSIKKNAMAAEGTLIATVAQEKVDELMALDFTSNTLRQCDPNDALYNSALCGDDRTLTWKSTAGGTVAKKFHREWLVQKGPEFWCPNNPLNNSTPPPNPLWPCSRIVTTTVLGYDGGQFNASTASRRGFIGKQQIVVMSTIMSSPVGGKVELN